MLGTVALAQAARRQLAPSAWLLICVDAMVMNLKGETRGRDSWRDSHLLAAPSSLSLSPPGDSVQSPGFVPSSRDRSCQSPEG